MPYTTSRKALVVKTPYTNTFPRLLNADEVAENLGISKSSVQRLIKTGQITSLKIGSSRRVTEQSLTNYIAKLESQFKQEFREAIS
jgi:excisionase family DNA binding protein